MAIDPTASVASVLAALDLRLQRAEGGTGTPTPTPSLSISGTPAAATVGSGDTFTPTISGGTAPYTLSLLSGTLPPGRTVNGSAKTVTGTYTTAGTYSYVLRATDAANPALTADLTVNVVVSAVSTPAPTFSALAVTQPASMAASWHEMHPLVTTDGNSVIFNASDEAGNARSLKINRATGAAQADKVFTPRQWVKDDHHAMSEIRLTSGVRLLAMCGHADRYASGAVVNQIAIARSVSGNWEDYPTDYANLIIITLPTSRIPNYIRLYQVPPGMTNAGMVLLKYNDDGNAVEIYITSTDDGITWVENRPHMGRNSSGWGGNVPQLYARDDWDAMYTGASPVTGAVQGTFVPSYGYLHPNCPGGAQCRFNWLDITTGKIYSPDNGNAVNSGSSAFTTGSVGSPMVTLPLVANAAAQNVRVPASGRTQRVNYVHQGLVYVTDMMQDMTTDLRHVISKRVNGTRTDFDLGPVGAPFWATSGYAPDLQPGFDPHTGDLAYRVTNDGTAKNSGGKLERIHWPNGIENGGEVRQTLWQAGQNGVPANLIAARFFPVRGAQATGVVGFLQTFTSYVRYDDWAGGQLYAIIRS